jgi:hypothetical protein
MGRHRKPDSERKVILGTFVKPAEHEAVCALARQEGVTVSAVARRLIVAGLEREATSNGK